MHYSLMKYQALRSTPWATQQLGPQGAPVETFNAMSESTWDTKIFWVTKGHNVDIFSGPGYHNMQGMSQVAIVNVSFNSVKVSWLHRRKTTLTLGTRQLHQQRFSIACQSSDTYYTCTLLYDGLVTLASSSILFIFSRFAFPVETRSDKLTWTMWGDRRSRQLRYARIHQ